MCRVALTAWFTLATLLGPWVCCCAVVPSLLAKSKSAGHAVQPAKLVKTCCHQSEQKPEPAHPSKCPCQGGKKFDSLPGGSAHSLRFDDLRADVAPFDSSALKVEPVPTTPTSTSAGSVPGAQPPAGRTLLAAYSRLRC